MKKLVLLALLLRKCFHNDRWYQIGIINIGLMPRLHIFFLMPRLHIPYYGSRLWYDHCRLKFVKSRIKIVRFGKEKTQICKKEIFHHDSNPMLSRKRPDSAVSSRFHPDSPVLNTNVIRFVFYVWCMYLSFMFDLCFMYDLCNMFMFVWSCIYVSIWSLVCPI